MKNRINVLTFFLFAGLMTCIFPAAASPSSIKQSGPVLPRDFALPRPLFAPNSAWNQTATGAAVQSASDQQLLVTYRVLRGDTTTLHPPGPPPTTWPFMDVNYDDYSIPIFRAGTEQKSVLICDYEGNKGWPSPKFPPETQQEGGPVTVPAPAGSVRPSGPQDTGADGHLVLYDLDSSISYDYWNATTVRNGECQSLGGGREGTAIFEAGVVEFFDVRGPGINIDTFSSARATGVPLLAGLILPEDIESGVISHALAFAIPGLRNLSTDPYEPLPSDYFYPTTTTETDFYNTNPHALAAGQRIRLKESIVNENGAQIDENQLAPVTQIFLTALRTYGAILVDNAGGFSFSAEDIHTANLNMTIDEVNALIGQPPGTPLPAGKTNWQVLIEMLNSELELIPFAYDESWQEGQDPAEAIYDIANFEVVEPASIVTSTVYLPLTQKNVTSLSSTSSEPLPLNEIKFWAYQIQDISVPGAVDALAASQYDMLVLEPTRTDWSSDDKFFNTKGMVERLKNSRASDGVHRKLLVAYIDIGEAEDWRWYWSWSQGWWSPWDCALPKPADWPAYLLTCDPDGWGGNYPVAYWNPNWKDTIIHGQNHPIDPEEPARNYTSVIDEVMVDGFDGIYLDWVEGFENTVVTTTAQIDGVDPAVEMIKFIQEMRTYATTRNPDFLIIQQNAASLTDGHPELLNVIDAIAQEGVWFDGDATDDWEDPDGYDWLNDPDLVDYYTYYLKFYHDAGLPVFNVEYALDFSDQAYTNAYDEGYIPYVTRRSLSKLTTTPPPGY